MNAKKEAAAFRIQRRTPKGGESAVATVARALIHPTTNKPTHRIDAYGQLVENSGKRYGSRTIYEDFINTDTTDQVSLILPTGAASSLTAQAVNWMYTPGGNVFCAAPLGVSQTVYPTIVAGGLEVTGEATDNEGWEIFTHFSGADGRPFIVGNDAAFFFECNFLSSDVSVFETVLAGFRRAEAPQAAYTSYADYAAVGWNTSAASADLKALTGNDGTDVATAMTAETIADSVALTIRVNVSAAGVITFLHDAASPGTLRPPAAGSTAYSPTLPFDDGDPVIPFFHFLHGSTAAGTMVIQSWKAGYQ